MLWFVQKDTRPLSITNADNRIIANLFKEVFAGYVSKVCCQEQKGFLNNRFLLENSIGIDFEARKIDVQKSNGALILADLMAAFPPPSHDSLFGLLERQGIAAPCRNVLSMF